MNTKRRCGRLLAGLAVSWAALVGTTEYALAEYQFTEYSMAGASGTQLWDVNNHGAMVGWSTSGPADLATGFIRASDGSLTTLTGPAGAISTQPMGISDDGVVVGSFATTVGGEPLGFIYSGGTYATFTVAGSTCTSLRGISPDGRYASGYYSNDSCLYSYYGLVGFVYDRRTGVFQTVSGPDSSRTIPQGINAGGVLVGSDVISGTPETKPGFAYDIAAGTRTSFSIAGARQTALRDIDDAGTPAGYFVDSAGGTHGFVGPVDIYVQVDFPGANQTYVQGSNNDGVLVGIFDAGHAFIATPTLTVADRLQRLANDVAGVGSGHSLADKIALAQTYYAAGDVPAACAVLTGFVNEVRAQRGKKISADTADALVRDAEELMAQMGCG